MAIKEQDKVFYEEASNGDKIINLPISRVNNIEGIGRSASTAYVVGDVVYVDNNKKVALKCTQAGITSNSELNVGTANIGDTVTDGSVVWKVIARSNVLDEDGVVPIINGGTGGELFIKSASINGRVITLTFADGTTETLITQDTNTTYKPNWNGYVQKTGTSFTAPSNGMVYLWNGTASNKYASALYVNSKQVGKHGVGNEGWTGQYGTLVAFVASGDVVSWSQSGDICYFVPFA